MVEESLGPGASVAAVARRHDVHPNLLHYWRRQAKRGLEGGQGKFLAVAVTATRRPGPEASGTIEIELVGGVRVRVDAAVDEAALDLVLRALRR